MILCGFQEGPENISVFNKWTRTTGALEAYNGVLGRKIIGKSHFFKFVKVLLDEEYRKCRELHSILHGRDDKRKSRSNKYQVICHFSFLHSCEINTNFVEFDLLKVRGEKIMANSKLMLQNRLDADEFLDRIVYQQDSDDFGMLDVTLVNISIDKDDDKDSTNEHEQIEPIASPTPSTQSSTSSQSVGHCALCEEEPELLVLPCFEFCVCQTCWEILKKNNDTPSCPSCKAAVTEVKAIKFYQH